MSSTREPENQMNDPEIIKKAHIVVLIELNRILRSMPAENASPQEIETWAEQIAAESREANQLSGQVAGMQSISDTVYSIVKPMVDPIWNSIASVENTARNSLNNLKIELEKNISDVTGRINAIEGLFGDVETKIKKKVWDVASYPVTLSKGLVEDRIRKIVKPVTDKLESALDLFEIARELEKANVLEVSDRLRWTGKALTFLLNSNKVITVTDVFDDLMKHEDRNKLLGDLEKLIETVLVSSNPMMAALDWIVKSAIAGELYMPEDMGYGLSPGRLYAFVNDPALEPGKNGGSGEREFRIELVSALDRYFRGEYDLPAITASPATLQSIQRVDGKTALQTLTDVFRILVQVSFGFVFRIPQMPSVIAPRMSLLHDRHGHQPQLVAARHASATLSRALASPIKAITGLLLRGFWEVSSHNEALVELVSSSVSQTLGSFVESVTHTLFALIEIREVYNDPSQCDRCLVSWPTQAKWDTKQNKTTFQAVVIRRGLLGDEEKEDALFKGLDTIFKKVKEKNRGSILESLLKDYGTYIEISRDYHEPDMTDNSIKVSATMKQQLISVQAEYDDKDKNLPIVLRVYAAGNYTIMDETYHAELNCDLENDDVVHVFAGTMAHGSLLRKDIKVA